MSIGWRVALELPAQPGQVAIEHFLASISDPAVAETEVRKFKAAPATSKVRAYAPVTREELLDRKFRTGEIRPALF